MLPPLGAQALLVVLVEAVPAECTANGGGIGDVGQAPGRPPQHPGGGRAPLGPMAWPRVSGGRCRCCRARALLTTLACRPMTKRRRTPSSEAASLMYVLRIHSRVFGVRWLLMTPSTCGVHHTVRGTYGTPAAGTRRRTYRGAPAARLRCVRPQEAGTRTPYGGPRTYVSARPSTSRRSVASPQRGRPPAAGRDTRICSEAGVELAGLGGDELPRCCRYLAEQRVGRSPRRRYFSRSRQWGIAFAAQLFSWRQTRKSASSDTQNLDFGLS